MNLKMGDEMQIKYTTQSGSVYIQNATSGGELWHKEDAAGNPILLAGAMHISRSRLQRLITEYPRQALDQTACFGEGIAREFFDDAKREGGKVADSEESKIFFLVNRGLGKYGLGYSSSVQRIETIDADQNSVKESA
ncbi:MAG: hypothetical protein ACYTET_05295 [Planctomycetota bacterium]